MALLAIDVGNTQTVFGLFEGPELREHWRSRPSGTAAATSSARCYGTFLDFAGVDGIALASTVPQLHPRLRGAREGLRPRRAARARAGIRTGVTIRYDDPREVGPDRIANAVAAVDRYGSPCIVVDFGTSTNFDVVSAEGEYVGGVLAPGIEVSMDALFQRAARLFKVDFVEPPTVIAKNTAASLQSGLVYGFAGPGRRHRRAHPRRARRGGADRRHRRSRRPDRPARPHARSRRPVPDARGPAPGLGPQPPGVKSFTVDLDGASLFVREWGESGSPALLYWDGLSGCGLHANELAPVLTKEHGLRVISPDPPGHGRSGALPPEAYRPSALAELAAAPDRRARARPGRVRRLLVGRAGRVLLRRAVPGADGEPDAHRRRLRRSGGRGRGSHSRSRHVRRRGAGRDRGGLVRELGCVLRIRARVARPVDARSRGGAPGDDARARRAGGADPGARGPGRDQARRPPGTGHGDVRTDRGGGRAGAARDGAGARCPGGRGDGTSTAFGRRFRTPGSSRSRTGSTTSSPTPQCRLPSSSARSRPVRGTSRRRRSRSAGRAHVVLGRRGAPPPGARARRRPPGAAASSRSLAPRRASRAGRAPA